MHSSTKRQDVSNLKLRRKNATDKIPDTIPILSTKIVSKKIQYVNCQTNRSWQTPLDCIDRHDVSITIQYVTWHIPLFHQSIAILQKNCLASIKKPTSLCKWNVHIGSQTSHAEFIIFRSTDYDGLPPQNCVRYTLLGYFSYYLASDFFHVYQNTNV